MKGMVLDNLQNSLSPYNADLDDFTTIRETLSTLKSPDEINLYVQQVTSRLRAPGSGFSLVELSIVLVILGILVGGVLSGQSLIHAAELRSVIRDSQKYMAATNAFRDKYNALPGDMANATSYWGSAAACPGVSTTALGGTCNGDGDGMITNAATTANPGNESLRYWQHLGLAGMIEGSFTGTVNGTTATTYTITPGVDVPASRIANVSWQMVWLGAEPISSFVYYDGNYGNALLVDKSNLNPTASVGPGPAGVLTCTFKAEDAWSIDGKVDDGKPSTGAVLGIEAGGTNTVCGSMCEDTGMSSSTSLPGAKYLLTGTAPACDLIFKSGS